MTTDALPGDSQHWLSVRLQGLQNTWHDLRPRLRDFFVHAIAQVRVLKKVYPGVMHFLIFWGMTIQVLGTAINLMQMQLFIPFVELTFPRGEAYLIYELVMDIAGLAILAGVAMALIRRIALRPKTLESRWDDYYALILLTLIPIAGFSLEGTRLLAAAPPWANWSPIGSLFAQLLHRLGLKAQGAANLHTLLFWTHATLGLSLVASIPFTKLRHVVMTPLNIVLRRLRHQGTLEKIENIEEAETLGVNKIEEFTPLQLLSFDACLRCGRCEEVCPANISGMPYSPRDLIQSFREVLITTFITPNNNNHGELLGTIIPENMPWYCTTCGACLVRCPAFVNPVDEIIDLRRYQVLTSGRMPKSVGDTLRNMERQGNPWGIPADDRIAWAEGLNVRQILPGEQTDVLLFLGCAFAFDERNKKVARSFVRLLQKSGVDFAILGIDEVCCGETARRLGHEYLFQMLAEQNIETLSKIHFNRIVTQCPHCFNTLKNEYPQMGGVFNVQHYTEFLLEFPFVQQISAPSENGLKGRITYHDSCYLGRHNQIYQPPRRLLKQAKVNTVEMGRRGENSFCCGGGGGQMWLETDPSTRINHRRLEDALKIKADIVATACPYCLLMFDDAIRSKGLGEKIQVMDIAEILDKSLAAL